jgi:hypothetical protein
MQKNKFFIRQSLRIILSTSVLIIPLLVMDAKACEYFPPVPASRETRAYRNLEAKFSFSIPANYRAMRVGIGNAHVSSGQVILIVEPSTYSYIQCTTRNNMGGDGSQESVQVNVFPIRPGQYSLYDLVVQRYPYMRTEGINFRNTTFVGRPALTYSQSNLLDDTMTSFISFTSLDARYLITISGPNGGAELALALSSFEFD